MRITDDDREVSRAYRAAIPDQFGNLHQRMRCAMDLMVAAHAVIPGNLWQAMFDLETELQYHFPAKPPFGRRNADATKDALPDPVRNIPASSSGVPAEPGGSGSALITSAWLDERFRCIGKGNRRLWFVHSVIAIGECEGSIWVPRIVPSGVALAPVRTRDDVDRLCKVIGG